MNIRSFAGSLTLVSLLTVLMPQPALHPQSPPKAPTSAKAAADGPIRFTYQPIDFQLETDETPERHAPETMAGGVAVFDYNNDGKLDIFFTNGADIHTLHKSFPKYRNRLFENDGRGHFTDVTEKAGLAGSGYDMGVAIGDYDNDGYEDIFVAGVYRNTLYHNNGDGTFTDVTAKAGLNKPDAALVSGGRVGRRQQRRPARPHRH
jgi:enediyne biosynthesis protein E4